jgi:hypothetical protein
MASPRIVPIAKLDIRDFNSYIMTDVPNKMVNCAIQKRGIGEGETVYISQRPSLEVYYDAGSAAAADKGRGIHYFNENSTLYFVNDDTIYANSYANPIATITSGDEVCEFTELGGYVVMLDQQNREMWLIDELNNVTKVTDADFPLNPAHGLVQLDGYLFVLDTSGLIWQSALDDPSSWSALDFVDAERENDGGKYICKLMDNIAVLGSRTIEFFYNAGNPSNSVLNRRTDVFYNIGCAFDESVWTNDNFAFFLGKDARGQLGVYKLQGMQIGKVSDSSLDNYLTVSVAESNVRALGAGFSANGTNYYLLTLYGVTAGGDRTYVATLVFEEGSGVWHLWDTDAITLPGETVIPLIGWTESSSDGFRAGEGILWDGQIISFSTNPTGNDTVTIEDFYESGFIESGFYESASTSTTPIDMVIRLGEVDWGTHNNKFIRNVEVVSNYTSTDQNMTVKWSDTDTSTFNTGRTINLSKRRKLSALGMTNKRTWQFEFSGTDPLFIEAFEFDVDAGLV